MKLYATITSERAEKLQGGNKFIQADFTVARNHAISITLKEIDIGTELWLTRRGCNPQLLDIFRNDEMPPIKGNKQKGKDLCEVCGKKLLPHEIEIPSLDTRQVCDTCINK